MSMQSEGGKARARALTAEERSMAASNAANARWRSQSVKFSTFQCSSHKSPECLKELVVKEKARDQAHRVLLKVNWIVLHDHEKIYGYMCPNCVKAHGPGTEIDES